MSKSNPDVAMLLRIVGKKQRGPKADAYLTVEPLGELMDDAWATINLRLPRELYERFVTELRRIATENELILPEKINSRGQGVTDVIDTLTGLLERTPGADLVRRW